MKPAFLFIFSFVFLVYFFANWYIFSKGLRAIEITNYKTLFTWVFWILVVSFPLGQFLERANPNAFFRLISFAGSHYLVLLLYALIMVAFIDLVRLFDGWINFIPQTIKSGILSGENIFLFVSGISLILIIVGHVNAANPIINKISIEVDKQAGSRNEIKAVLLTDIHMGVIIQNGRIQKMVNSINELNPDIILFGGDLVDHNPVPVIKKQLGEYFKQLNPELGMYAVTGNHEFIGHADVSIDYLSNFGIEYVRDTVINLGGVLNLAGRDDRDKPRFEEGEKRKDLADILNGIDSKLPLILMDHQPVEYDKAESAGVDLMLSGHTHKGQIWPFGYITSAIYENHYGLIKKGNSHFYTSSGYGTWGPPVRIGNRPEIVEITIHLK
ncbi:metallophosphoesterase [Candidatus Venteria ishoeyi]|uniref:Putative metallophosphoesterase n=1 Tax=Candidatus Venteria ishoeyi TaxID=1899563 RepID=A0A1H6F501_9GAMM|nr:metallophosphoesterase [Candidatus Venteria ishoeyi]SEH05237.1 putative metallophosphoesterase [Candidatus Venteria ishoeyi]